MKKPTIIRLLEFFTGVFFGVSFFGACLCFFILKDFNTVIAFIVSIAFFGIFSFFAIVAKALIILLKHDESKHL